MADKNEQRGAIGEFVLRFFGSTGLLFFPLPISIFKRQLVGHMTDKTADVEFYSHPNFVCTMHLVWIGWIVGILKMWHDVAEDHEWKSLVNPEALGWVWLFVLLVTVIVMGLHFNRVAMGFLIASAIIVLLLMWLGGALLDLAVFGGLLRTLARVKVAVAWGVPMFTSLVLGLAFMAVAAWRRMNDRWILKHTGNYLEHENFQEKDRTISKGAKTFVAVYPCLVRRYLFFGFGDIEVRSSTGTTLIDRIEGVFFARHHADVIKSRFGTTDIRAASEEEEEEAAADEAL